MQIHFTREFQWGEPTYFIEKIWAGFALNDFLLKERSGGWATEVYKDKFPYKYDWFPIFMKVKPKLHTIREDKNNRWFAGRNIHFMQWTKKPYTSKCYRFAPLIPCESVQEIEIFYKDGLTFVKVDNRSLRRSEVEILAKNDGFESIEDFFKWFSKDFKGKIIHWTDLKY